MLGRPSVAMAFGVGLGLLLAVARVAAVNLALTGSPLDRGERGVVTALVPRGLAAGVLATFPVTAGLKSAEQMPDIVYAAVITTIVVFALTLPRARTWLKPSPETASGAGSETSDSGAAHEPAPAG
jgi:cell volume regulation protein A